MPQCPHARLPGDPDWPDDYDAGDIRYSSISLSISRDKTYSVGPSTVDPRSGEILDADISFAQEWVHAWTGEIDAISLVGENGATDDDDVAGAAKEHAHGAHGHDEHGHGHDGHRCGRLNGLRGQRVTMQLVEEMRHHARVMAAAEQEKKGGESADGADGADGRRRTGVAGPITGQTAVVPRSVIGAGLADVTAHEVGHTLGLRHNFKGSAALPYDRRFDKE